jgi:hypothetical protein
LGSGFGCGLCSGLGSGFASNFGSSFGFSSSLGVVTWSFFNFSLQSLKAFLIALLAPSSSYSFFLCFKYLLYYKNNN